MKKIVLLFTLVILSFSVFSQTKPDTLIIETPKKQRIILIADDINSFRNIKSDSLINLALSKVRDSLRTPGISAKDFRAMSKEEKAVYTRERAMYIKRRNDSLFLIDGLTPKERFKKNSELSHSDKSKYSRNVKNDIPFSLKFNLGGGLIRSKFSPVFEGGIVFLPQKQDYYSLQWIPAASFISLTANRYYTFEQTIASTSSTTFNNTFLNLSLGNRFNTKLRSNLLLSEYEAGIGYLVEREGSYFGKNTIKLFASVVTKSKFIRLSPEIYITDNFKEVFPGFSIKIL